MTPHHTLRTALLLATALVAIHTASAQRIHAFATVGASVNQIEGDELKGFKHIGFTGGVGTIATLDSRNRWGLSVETLYSQRGAYNNSGDPYSIRLTLPYVDIPVMLHYQDPYGGMLLGIGLDYSRMVGQPHDTIKINPNSFVPDTTDLTFLRNDVMIVADARFTIWRGLQLNLRWQHSLLPIKRDWRFDEYTQGRWRSHTRDCYNHSVVVRLIYQF